MIEIAGKSFRNLQEQVAWLTLMINRATDIVKNVQGTAATAGSLPSASMFSNGTTYAVGSAAPYTYYVAINGSWVNLGTMPLAGPSGAAGSNGNSIFITSQATDSSTTTITTSSIYNPMSFAINPGNLILSEQGDIFEITTSHPVQCTVLWRCNIIGPTGATGATGSQGPIGLTGAAGKGVYYSSDATTSSTTVITGTSIYNPDSRTIGAGDIILSSTGDIFTVTSISGSVANVTYRENIVGAAGVNGADGSMFYAGDDVYCSSPADPGDPQLYIIAEADLPSGIKDGDYYMVNSTYTSGGVSINNGDLLEVISILSGIGGYLIKVGNIAGPQGPTGPGMPVVSISDAGKFAVVDSSGHWAAITMNEWSGGSY